MTATGPLRVGLTGGIATGKSYCLAQFSGVGVATIDADVLARDAVAPGSPALAAIAARFGSDVLKPGGQLDREALGRRVFADASAREALERIVHPVVYEAIGAWFTQIETTSSRSAFAIADVPLLFETGHAADFDRVIVTSCRPEQQLERLLARGGLTEIEARQRIAAQWPLADKVSRADFVIDTSGSKVDTNRQVGAILEELRKAEGKRQKA